MVVICVFFFFQAEDGIRDLVRSRGLGDVYKRQGMNCAGVWLRAAGVRPLLDPSVQPHATDGSAKSTKG